MFKTILRYVLIGLLVYFIRGFFETVLPIPTENMVDGLLDLTNKGDQKTLYAMRFIVWVFITDFSIRYAKPLFNFVLPTARRYTVTKPFRRIQGIIAEFTLIGLIFFVFSLLCLLVTLPMEFNKKFNSAFKSLTQTLLMSSLDTDGESEDKLCEKAAEANEWITSEILAKDKSIKEGLLKGVGLPIYVSKDDWFSCKKYLDNDEKYPERPRYYLNYFVKKKDYYWGGGNPNNSRKNYS